MSLKLEQGK